MTTFLVGAGTMLVGVVLGFIMALAAIKMHEEM